MLVAGYRRQWQVNADNELLAVLEWRDKRGGAEFWLSHGDAEYPCLAIRLSGDIGDVTYFPDSAHPGFRCLANGCVDPENSTRLVYEGVDPAVGEDVPNEFVVPFASAVCAARDFLESGRMSVALQWFEL